MINAPKTVAIFIPTLGRVNRLRGIVENLHATTRSFTPYFIIEKDDLASINAVTDLGLLPIINEGLPCYADAINTAYHKTNEPYFFSGADDLKFYPFWFENAVKLMRENIGVVGTNDLGGIPIGTERDATHYLVKRAYIQKYSGRADMPDTVLYPYDHNYTDKELVETARSRGAYAYAPDSIVEHIHPAWGKAQMDETYNRGLRMNEQDKQTFLSRQHLWGK